MKRILAILIMLALPLMAQEQKKPEEAPAKPSQPGVQKLFILKYADPNQLGSLLNVFPASIRPNSGMHALAVAASPEAMVAIEDAIRQLDVPGAAPKDLELIAYFLVGRSEDRQDLVSDSAQETPKELESVVSQLRSAFAFKSYRLLESLSLRTRTGQRSTASSSGAARNIFGRPIPIATQVTISSADVEADGRIRVSGLRVSQRVPYVSPATQKPTTDTSLSYTDLGFTTDVDLKDGQKVVIGRNALNPQEAIFLVLTAHVIQ
jgi:hypothetical protein